MFLPPSFFLDQANRSRNCLSLRGEETDATHVEIGQHNEESGRNKIKKQVRGSLKRCRAPRMCALWQERKQHLSSCMYPSPRNHNRSGRVRHGHHVNVGGPALPQKQRRGGIQSTAGGYRYHPITNFGVESCAKARYRKAIAQRCGRLRSEELVPIMRNIRDRRLLWLWILLFSFLRCVVGWWQGASRGYHHHVRCRRRDRSERAVRLLVAAVFSSH